jgi:hypothetical protein
MAGLAERMEKFAMVVIICVAGAVLGLVIALVSARLVLPMVLRSLEERSHDRRIGPPWATWLNDAARLRALVIAVYRYVIPLVFAAVGAMAAYYLFVADAR